MKIFISGGSKSGKSICAQQLSARMQRPGAPLYYLATMIPKDSEDEKRIIRHQQGRDGWGFETIEVENDIHRTVTDCDKRGTFLLDSVTALLANEMFTPDGRVEPDAYKKIADDLTKISNRIDDMIIVSDYIYSDAFLYDELTDLYRQGLGFIGRKMATVCDVVLEASGGICVAHKGGEIFHEFD